jgi:hypothetical protein
MSDLTLSAQRGCCRDVHLCVRAGEHPLYCVLLR